MRSISFVIPCYNEEKRLNKTFEALRNFVSQGKPSRGPALRSLATKGLKLAEVIFVDDGSTDRTFEKIQKWISNQPSSLINKLSVISYKSNRGKGYAIREGMLALSEAEGLASLPVSPSLGGRSGLASSSDYTLFFDADISTPLSEIKKFAPLIKAGADVIIGTRKNGGSTVVVHQPIYRELLGRIFTQLTRLFLQTDVSDFTCGFKAFSKKAVGRIFPKAKINGWGYDAELLFLAKKSGLVIWEVPVIWSNDEATRVALFSAIIKTLWELIQIRWSHTIKPILKFLIPNLQFSFKSKFSILKLFEN